MELQREARGPGSQYHKLASGKPKPGLSSAVQRQTRLLWDSTGGVLAQSGSPGPVLLLAGGCVVAHLAWCGRQITDHPPGCPWPDFRTCECVSFHGKGEFRVLTSFL